MKVIHNFLEFQPPFLGNKRKTRLARSQNMCTNLIQALLRKIEQICETANFVKSGWSDISVIWPKTDTLFIALFEDIQIGVSDSRLGISINS